MFTRKADIQNNEEGQPKTRKWKRFAECHAVGAATVIRMEVVEGGRPRRATALVNPRWNQDTLCEIRQGTCPLLRLSIPPASFSHNYVTTDKKRSDN